jgi:hypothetical protein
MSHPRRAEASSSPRTGSADNRCGWAGWYANHSLSIMCRQTHAPHIAFIVRLDSPYALEPGKVAFTAWSSCLSFQSRARALRCCYACAATVF